MPTLRGSGEFILPSDKEAEERIFALYEQLEPWQKEEGFIWYFQAFHQCQAIVDEFSDLDLSHDQVAGIIAALSPQASWEQNIDYVRMLLSEGTAPTLGHAVKSAMEIRFGAEPISVLHASHRNNWKVRAFHSNISSPDTSEDVTIDRHAWNLIFKDTKAIKRAGRRIPLVDYRWAEERYRTVAGAIGCKPHQLQAATWLRWKPYAAGDRPNRTPYMQHVLFESV